mmetsp:Transcript_15706/g.54545  ORF Transcript_15706/g.54545 Transcript_15706/m.54545 type:complete len:238 (-) Transcript_15706:317-1030(-)
MEVGHASGGDDAAARARRASARAVWYYWGLQASCAAGDLPALNAVLARLAAARAAEEGCSEAEAARAIVVEARDVERVEGRPALLGYLVHTVLYGRAGGVGPGGWLGCLRRCFEAAGDSAPLLAAAVDALGSSALHYACHNLHTSGDRAEACAAVACLLAHGADATATTNSSGYNVSRADLSVLVEIADLTRTARPYARLACCSATSTRRSRRCSSSRSASAGATPSSARSSTRRTC